ncbi:MAG: Hsp20/alpha crystallin family protein [bacterium]|nr:Hsp20/alpha crystallin family protein [bacterium]
MHAVTDWNPSCRFGRYPVERAFDRLFHQFFVPAPVSEREEDVAEATWAPAVDVKESEEALTVLVELPGVEKKDIDISLKDNVLTLTGQRTLARDEEKESYHRVERTYGKFRRSFRLPANVQGDKVAANFKDGVLSVEIPKAEEAKPRQIEIN